MGVGVIPLVLSLVFPACGKSGAAGVKPPGIADFAKLHLPKTPNKALAAPPEFKPRPDFITPTYRLPPARLLAVVDKVAVAQPRTYALDSYPGAGQAAWVARSKIANFPDVIEAAVAPAAGGSTLILYSHSIYGRGDFGVNKARVKTWLAAIGQLAAESDREQAR